MINRIKHKINGVDFVPVNKDSFSLSVQFAEDLGEWRNNFTTGNKVVLPNEGYEELIRHLNDVGVQQMPTYTIAINNLINKFYVDLTSGVLVSDTKSEISLKNYKEKNNVKDSLDNLTFEQLYRNGIITEADMVKVPYVVIPDDIAMRIVISIFMIGTLTEKLINQINKITERTGDLIAASTPQPAPPSVATPIGLIVRYAMLLIMDIAIAIAITAMLVLMTKEVFNYILPPLRYYKAMTFDRLLTKSLSKYGLNYQSSLKSDFKRFTIIPVPIDYKKKKFFESIMGLDDKILNRGYPTSSDSVNTAGRLIEEICKIFNIQPRIVGNNVILEPKANVNPTYISLDGNFNKNDVKENEFELDTSKLWNTKIVSYQNDPLDKLLYDNPKGLRVEYNSTSTYTPDDLTIIKGMEEIRIPFALGTIKKDTKLDTFLSDLAKVTDNLLGTNLMSKINKRKGVLAVGREQFSVTKLIYQVGGKQTFNYLDKIGAEAIYKGYHLIDEPKNNLYLRFKVMPIRMSNEQFLNLLENNFVDLEGIKAEVTAVNYIPENSYAEIDFKVRNLDFAKRIKTVKIYAE